MKPLKQQNSHQSAQLINKQAISHRFGKSAASYDRGAALQRNVGNQLLQLLPVKIESLVDLGCGPGYFTSALAARSPTLLSIDIAPSMLEFARARNQLSQVMWLAGDAEQLPLQADSVDAIYSSLMLQWVHDLSAALKEAARALKPGGTLCFSTLLDGSLFELVNAWRLVDNHAHVNSFLTLEALMVALKDSGLELLSLDTKAHCLYYDSVIGLMRDLKAIGANQTSRTKAGLMGRSTLDKLATGYEKYRGEQGLSATYQVAYCVLTKPIPSTENR